MNFIHTEFNGLTIIEPRVIPDNRGYFFESYNEEEFKKEGLYYKWVQDNQSMSSYGVIRGLHFQTGEYEQAKLVRCLNGSILDVVVDLRPNSKTFKKYYSIELTSENKKMILIPRGFAHGFSVISSNAEVMYKCDNIYNKESEGSLIYSDPTLNIDWKIIKGYEIISEKDLLHPTLDQLIFIDINKTE